MDISGGVFMNAMLRTLVCAGLVAPLLFSVACTVNVDKGADGKDKRVKIDTPLGGIHVNTDQAAAANPGLPVYPGSAVVPDKDGDKAADIHMGFGPWQLRVKVVSYSTPDGQDKVLSFYRSALGGPKSVIECRGDAPVGSPARTPQGLSCTDDDQREHVHNDSSDILLKAGSKRHQQLLAIEKAASQPAGGPTKFSTILLDLPAQSDEGRQTD
jgi:hypothetical protein